jgi:hypothetical protein
LCSLNPSDAAARVAERRRRIAEPATSIRRSRCLCLCGKKLSAAKHSRETIARGTMVDA